MLHHVLVSKGLWKIIVSTDLHPISRVESISVVDDEVDPSRRMVQVGVVEASTTQKQRRWDSKDEKAHALAELFVKHSIIPHI